MALASTVRLVEKIVTMVIFAVRQAQVSTHVCLVTAVELTIAKVKLPTVRAIHVYNVQR